jgi:hypothetical protein
VTEWHQLTGHDLQEEEKVTEADGSTLYAWQVQEPDGRWSMVGALVPELGTHTPLVHRKMAVVRRFEQLAREHAVRTNQKLRLAKFVLDSVVDQ